MRTLTILAAILSLTACAPEPSPPDILVVVLDTVRPDRLGFYGADEEPAPFLASIVEDSKVFTAAMSTSSWTAPATASLHTGLYPPQHGVVEGMMAHQSRAREIEVHGSVSVPINSINPEAPTLAERLQELGYRTWGLAANPNIGEEMGFWRGFDRSERLEPARFDVYGRPAPGKRGTVASAPADRVLARLREWVEEEPHQQSRFVYLHLNDAHRPYHRRAPWYEPSEDRIRSDLSAYDSEIHFMDAILAQIWELLGVDEGDLVVVVSDHGEGFNDHGIRYHEWGLYQATNRVLMMFYGPDLGVVAGRSATPVSLIDVLPTLMEVQGLEANGLPGSSLLSLLRMGANQVESGLDDRMLFAHRLQQGSHPRVAWAARSGPWKLILDGEEPELYQVVDDPWELSNLATAHSGITSRLLKECLDFQRWDRPAGSESSLRLDEERLEALRALGYVD